MIYGQVTKLPDSVSVYLKSKRPFDVAFGLSYQYAFSHSDEHPEYAIRAGRILLKKSQENNYKAGEGKSNYLIGYGYAGKENFVLALDYFFKALPDIEKTDTVSLMNIYNTIGISYSQQKQHKKAASYFEKVINYAKAKKSKITLGISYNNIAIEYQRLKNYSLSDHYLKMAYRIFEENERQSLLPTILMNQGVIRFEKGMYDSALYIYRQAKVLSIKYNAEVPSSISNNLGEVFYKMGYIDSALFYLNHSLTIIDTINDRYSTREIYQHLANVYSSKGNYEKAYYYLKKNNHVNNIIYNDENLKKSLESEANFGLLKKENELKLSEERRVFDQKRNSFYNIIYLIAGLALVVTLIIIFYRFREKKKANAILTLQKNQIQEQQREITDSINYAKRIQDSILPSKELMQRVLGEHVLFYRPRDIVGGDFYYVEKVGDKSFFSVIDCTGHGVPGGFMSMLGYNGLQNAILDLKIEQPGKILDCLSQNLVTHFSQEGKQTLRDGMDMALCCLYKKGDKFILEFAGAHNPCWIIKSNTNELIEIKASKQPIGYFEDYQPFTTHTVELEKGDLIYLFSDGYADQFGGPEKNRGGKKFKYSKLKELLKKQVTTSTEKEKMLIQAFDEWKDDLEQVDDVCILGVRIGYA